MKKTGKHAIRFAAAIFLAAFALSAQAATYTVTNTNDDGEGSLRAAVNAANSTPAGDTINFNIQGCENNVCVIGLSDQLIVASAASSGSLTISNATGAERLSIRGTSVLPETRRIMEISGGGNLTIEGVTLTNGGTYLADGGAINNYGSLTLRYAVVRDSAVYGGGGEPARGGGIYNGSAASLTLFKTTVTGNRVSGAYGGGGIFNDGGTVVITDSAVTNNSVDTVQSAGGGINSSGGTLTLTDSSVNGNSNVGSGGGISCAGCALTVTNSNLTGNTTESGGAGMQLESAAATITNSLIGGNTATYEGGGISVLGGNLSLRGSTVGGNRGEQGGGIFIGGGGIATIRDSLIDNNSQAAETFAFGGGINNLDGVATLINSTVTRNSTSFYPGGGIANFSEMSIINSTISRNSGGTELGSAGGIYNGSTLSMRNSIVAGNHADFSPDVYNQSGFTSKGNNLIGDPTDSFVSWQASDILNQSALLAPLGNYGGAAQTVALTNDSPAISAGNNCVVTANGCGDNNPAVPTDARGAARVGAVDIGAFELNNTLNGGNFRAATPAGRVGAPFSYLITPESGAFSYSVTAGSLPPGLSLSGGLQPLLRRSASKNSSFVPQAGAYTVSGTPTVGGTFNYTVTATDGTNAVSTDYATTIQAPPTAAGVSVGGQVLGETRGIFNARVALTDRNGQTRTTRTNSFGYFRFENVAAGETYIVSVSDKRYVFAPRVVSPADDVTGLIFTPEDDPRRLSLERSK